MTSYTAQSRKYCKRFLENVFYQLQSISCNMFCRKINLWNLFCITIMPLSECWKAILISYAEIPHATLWWWILGSLLMLLTTPIFKFMSATKIVKEWCSGTHQRNSPIAFLDQLQLVQGRIFHHRNNLFILNWEKKKLQMQNKCAAKCFRNNML